jgi:hypothetical protein
VTVTNSANYTVAGQQFPIATEDSDPFDATHVQDLAKAVEEHDHTATKGLPVQRLHASQAAGDTFYASSATAIERLAKGTANYVYQMNAGGTAPEWGLVTADNLTPEGVLEASLANGSVTVNKIGAAAVTQAKLGTDTLQFAYVPILASGTAASFTSTGPTNWGELVDGASYGHTRFLFNKDKVPAGATVKLVARGLIAASGATQYGVFRLYNLTTAAAVGAVEISMVGAGVPILDVKASADIYASLTAGENKYCIQGAAAEAGLGFAASLFGAYLIVEW